MQGANPCPQINKQGGRKIMTLDEMHRKSGFYLFAKSLFCEKIVAKKPFLC